jgi:hypothetical protein
MSQPISMCMVYKAARGDEKAFKWMVDAMDYNSTQMAFTQCPCECKPPCPKPTDDQLKAFNDRLNKALKRIRVIRDVVARIGRLAEEQRKKVLLQVERRLGRKVCHLMAKRDLTGLTDPRSAYGKLTDKGIAWLKLKAAMLPSPVGDFSKWIFPVIKCMPKGPTLEEIFLADKPRRPHG